MEIHENDMWIPVDRNAILTKIIIDKGKMIYDHYRTIDHQFDRAKDEYIYDIFQDLLRKTGKRYKEIRNGVFAMIVAEGKTPMYLIWDLQTNQSTST